MTGTLVAYRWELRKLVSQKRTYLGFGLAIVLPVIFVVSQLLRGEHGHPGALVVGGDVGEIGLVGGVRRPPDALPTASGTERRQRRHCLGNDLRRLVRELAELEVADDVGIGHR